LQLISFRLSINFLNTLNNSTKKNLPVRGEVFLFDQTSFE